MWIYNYVYMFMYVYMSVHVYMYEQFCNHYLMAYLLSWPMLGELPTENVSERFATFWGVT